MQIFLRFSTLLFLDKICKTVEDLKSCGGWGALSIEFPSWPLAAGSTGWSSITCNSWLLAFTLELLMLPGWELFESRRAIETIICVLVIMIKAWRRSWPSINISQTCLAPMHGYFPIESIMEEVITFAAGIRNARKLKIREYSKVFLKSAIVISLASWGRIS